VPFDRATLALSVVTRNGDAAQAAAENAARMTAVRQALAALGVGQEAVSTSNYSVYRETGYGSGANAPGEYRVANRLNVTVQTLDLVGQMIDAAIRAGANELSSLDYSSSDTENALREARIRALRQAKATARLFAAESSAKLGRVLHVADALGAPVPAYAPKTARALADSVGGYVPTPIGAGANTVTAAVSVTYELK
jgi:uncharacterized protein YggE